MRRIRSLPGLGLLVIALLVAARAAAVAGLRAQLDDWLAQLEDQEVRFEGPGLSLWRGALWIENLSVRSPGRPGEPAVLEVERLELSLRLRSLLGGRPTGEVRLRRPLLRWGAEPGSTPVPGGAHAFPAELAILGAGLSRFAPVPLGRVVVDGGRLVLWAGGSSAAPDLELEHLEVELVPTSHAHPHARGHPRAALDSARDVWLAARTSRGGRVRAFLRSATEAGEMRFELDLLVQDLELVDLAPLLRRALDLEVDEGALHLSLELASEGGRVRGNLRPTLEGLSARVTGADAGPDEVLVRLGDALRALSAAEVQGNPARRILAASIPIEGQLEPDWLARLPLLLEDTLARRIRPHLCGSTHFDGVGG